MFFGFYGWGSAILIFQIGCIIHAVRTDRTSWIWIILFFPLIGCLAYLASEVRRPRRLLRGSGRGLASQIAGVVQPSRRLIQLRAEVEENPSVNNRMALADECLKHRLYDEALRHYDAASTGVHADDPAVLTGRAEAQLETGDAAAAKATLEHLFATKPRERTPARRLLFARAVEASGDDAATLAAYEAALAGAIGDEARCRYANALSRAARTDEALAIYTKIVKDARRATWNYRRDNKAWIETAKARLDEVGPASRGL